MPREGITTLTRTKQRKPLVRNIVNSTTSSSVHKMEALATKALKKWMKLPRNATQAILYHPDVLNVPSCDSLKTKAKLSFLVAIDHSTDHLIQELKPLLPSLSFKMDLTSPLNATLYLFQQRNLSHPFPKLRSIVTTNCAYYRHNAGTTT